MNTRNLLDKLSTKLAILERKVVHENKTADYSLNIHLEDLFIKILNTIYDYNLVNVNQIRSNFAGIDAIDKEQNIAFQITSTFSKRKIENTIKKIISNNIYSDFEILFFFFLTTKGSLSLANQKSILNIIDNKFYFNPKLNLYDSTTIYEELKYKNDISKIVDVINFIDEFIDGNPNNKLFGLEAVAVIFDDIDIENSYIIVDTILKSLINVYISSKELYARFKAVNHRLIEYLVLVKEKDIINHLNYAIIILSDNFIKNNLETEERQSFLLNHTILKNNQIFIFSFDSLLDTRKIKDKEFKTFQTLPKEKEGIPKYINATIDEILDEKSDSSYSTEDVIDELKSNYHNFVNKELFFNDDPNFKCLKFEMNDFPDIKLYYLILNRNYNLKQTHKVFKLFSKKYQIKVNNLIILVPKNYKQKTRRRLDIVKKSFRNCEKIYFIDEHLFDKRFKDYPEQGLLATPDFVFPIIKTDNDIKGLNDIMHWITEVSDSPISIISAPGGVGKTTLCEKIHDKILTDYERYIVIFIDPENFLNLFKKIQLEEDYNIYSLYKACSTNSELIDDERTFLLNYKLGNIVMIFDGIDETISTVQDFTLDKFIKKLMSLEQKIGKGKIIINCRDNYIEDFKSLYEDTEQIKFYDLQPFNKELAKEYFENHFKGQSKKVKECLSLLQKFVNKKEVKGDQYIYPPFVLEIIKQIVIKEFKYEEADLTFKSDFLIEEDIIDYIFYKTCNREIAKKESRGFVLDVDEQVDFMIKLAVEEKGIIDKNDINKLLIDKDRNDEFVIGIIDHPFLKNTNSHYTFRFSFLENHFKAIHIFRIINGVYHQVNDFDLRLLSNEFNYNSLIFKSVISKIKKTKENNFCLKIERLIKSIIDKPLRNKISTFEKKVISNLFLLYVDLAKYFHLPKEINRIQKVFGNEKKEISNFYLYDVPKELKLKLDFNELYFSLSEIKGYDNFFNCLFNRNTFFDETCHINDVYNVNLVFEKILASQENFDKNIRGDNSINKVFNLKGKPNKIIFDSLKVFFKCFYDGRNLKFNKTIIEIKSCYHQKARMNVIIDSLIFSKILSVSDTEISIDKKYHRSINKFIFEGLNFSALNLSIKYLFENITDAF